MKRTFENNAYRYYRCGCYRWTNVTSIDARGNDLCPDHAMAAASRRYSLIEDRWWIPVALLVATILWAIAYFDH